MSKGKSSLQWWADELISLRDKNLPEAEFENGKKILFAEYNKRLKEEQREIYKRGEIEPYFTYEGSFEEYYQKYFEAFVGHK
jgi:hypothetical protein